MVLDVVRGARTAERGSNPWRFELKNDNLRTLTAVVQRDDGQWTQFMTMGYHRKK